MDDDVLTANCGRLAKDFCHLSIHLNHEVLLHCHLFVPSVDLIPHPFRKLFLKNSCAHVSNPLLGSLWEFERGLRQIGVHLRMLLVKIAPDFLDSKPFIPAMKIVVRLCSCA